MTDQPQPEKKPAPQDAPQTEKPAQPAGTSAAPPAKPEPIAPAASSAAPESAPVDKPVAPVPAPDSPSTKPTAPISPPAAPAVAPVVPPAAPAAPPVVPAVAPVVPPAAPPVAPIAPPASANKPVEPSSPAPRTYDLGAVASKVTDSSQSSLKVTQRFPEPSAAAGGGVICPTCAHRNRPGTLICDNCGTNLMSGGKSTIGTRDLKSAQADDQKDGNKLLDTDQVKAVEAAGGSVFNDDMVLRVEIEGGTTPMLVYPKQEIIIGRRDPNSGGMPDVDLTSYAGYRMGVSRRHSAIRMQEKRLYVSDLGSSNGTFLNGTRLSAHRPYQIRDGDEIRLGQMVLRVFFQSAKK